MARFATNSPHAVKAHCAPALLHILPIAAAHHRFHEQGLEDEQAEGEAGKIFDDEVEPHRQAEGGGDDGGEDDACGIAGDAMDGRADALLPERTGESLVLARARLLVGKHIKQQTERAHIERHQDEAPFHHHRLGSFLPEFISMNFMMAGMAPVMSFLMMGRDMRAMEPTELLFWGVMSLGVIAGFTLAYPANVWLVARGLKHGLMTERARKVGAARRPAGEQHAHMQMQQAGASGPAGTFMIRAGPSRVRLSSCSFVVVACSLDDITNRYFVRFGLDSDCG